MKKFKINKLIILISFLAISISPMLVMSQDEENEIPAEVTSLEYLFQQ
jgi:hypothetical protein